MIQLDTLCWDVIYWLDLPRWNQFRIPADKVNISIQITTKTLIWMRSWISIKILISVIQFYMENFVNNTQQSSKSSTSGYTL
jgi:hypothetical protein